MLMDSLPHQDQDERMSDSPNIDQVNIKLMLAIAASKGWGVVSSDMKSAFLQGKEITREAIMKPPPEANVQAGTELESEHSFVCLEEASLQLHFKWKLHLKQYKLDPTLFYEHNQRGELIGMLGTHVDDFLKTEWKIQTLNM